MKKDWRTKLLEEVCLFSNGLWKGEKPPFVNVGVIRNTNFTKEGTLDDSEIAFLDVEAKKFETRRLRFGDVIVEKSGGGPKQPVGRAALFEKKEGDFSFSNFTAALRVREPGDLDFRFLHKFLHWTYISGVTAGMQSHSTGIRNLDGDAYKAIAITFPSLAEQQRIVGILDEAFEGIAIAKANAEKNLQNARALFESHLQSVFNQRGDGWVEKRLDEVCVIGDGNHSSNYPKREELVAKGVPFIRATNIVAGGVSGEDMRFLSPEKHAQLKKGHLKTGDILFTNRGEIGKTAIVDSRYDGSNLNSQIAWLRCGDAIGNRFLFHVLNSSAIKAHLDSSKNGAALQQFTIRQLKDLKVPVPPTKQQSALVSSIDALQVQTQRLADLYTRKLAALEALKKSLLHQAFSGAL
jgi:type I restriction enzyme, S subunit